MNNYIKKIAKNKVEKALGVKLESNKISMGADVAQHLTGLAIIYTTESYLVLDVVQKISVPKKIKATDSMDLFIDQLDRFKDEVNKRYKLNNLQIEDCFMLYNVSTLKSLARFGALIYDRFKGIVQKIDFVLATSARAKINFKKSSKKIKGKALKQEVIDYVNETLETSIKDEDEADAIVLSLAGLIK